MSEQEQKRIPQTRKTTQPSLYEQYITPKIKKDLTFGLVGFVGMCMGIFHYAYIMKQWLMDPYMSYSKLIIYAITFLVHVSISIYFYLFKYYPQVYAEEIAQEKAELEELKKQDEARKLRKNQ